MSDIVERLRRLYESADGRCYYWAQDAADEIEKLRAERDALLAALDNLLDAMESEDEGPCYDTYQVRSGAVEQAVAAIDAARGEK